MSEQERWSKGVVPSRIALNDPPSTMKPEEMRNMSVYRFLGSVAAVVLLPAIFLASCTSGTAPAPTDTATPAPANSSVAAQGPVGSWTSTVTKEDLLRVVPDFKENYLCENSGTFVWNFNPDGTFAVDQTALPDCATPANPHIEGTWVSEGNRVTFGKGTPDEEVYELSLEGDSLTLKYVSGKCIPCKAVNTANPWKRVNMSAPTPTTAPAAAFEGLSTGLDNDQQARLRIVSGVTGAPNVDLYINDLPVLNGGKEQQNLGVGSFSGWVYVVPGTYTVALVPHDGAIEEALTHVEVNAEVGHRYTVAAMGQLAAKNIKPLVVDETALEAGISTKATNDIYITINNLNGLEGLDLRHDSKVMATTRYGEASAMACTSRDRHFEEITVAGKPEELFASAQMWCHLGVSSAAIAYGQYPDYIEFSSDSQGTSEAKVLDFLAEFNNYQVTTDEGDVLTFKTLLAAIDKAGLRDLFSDREPHFFLAPTDEAFAALPKDQLDALLADQRRLAELLKTHFVEGYFPYGSLSGPTFGRIDREVTNLLGQKLKMLDDTINGIAVAGPNYSVGNGNRLQFVDRLLLAR